MGALWLPGCGEDHLPYAAGESEVRQHIFDRAETQAACSVGLRHL